MNEPGVIVNLASHAVSAMTPLLFAAMGGLFTELAGMLNIALEGLMLTGAFFAIATAQASGSPLAGIVAGGLSAALLAWAYGSASIRLKANIFIAGLAANIFASGMSVVLSQRFFGSRSVLSFDLPDLWKPFGTLAESVPVAGPILMSHNVLAYLSWTSVALCAFILYRTTFGSRMRATGAKPEAVAASGFAPDAYRLGAIVLSGLFCGLAGASLSLPLEAYVPNMSSGRGWIALVAVYLGAKKPGLVALACFVFALAESYSNYAQGIFRIPSEFLLAIPYAATLIALITGSVVARSRAGSAK